MTTVDKAKMDLEAAKQELVRCSGAVRPKVVVAMVKVVGKMQEQEGGK